MRDRIPYYDTLYAAFEMVASGTTTAQHLHGWLPGDPRQNGGGGGVDHPGL